ncbi:facilitated trehalose transporter Tret1-like isoform X2 [Adelges cooleyi]|nr:facilitated trehalose transporter Tret1-like isoform X2 [Adelges cooleyi]
MSSSLIYSSILLAQLHDPLSTIQIDNNTASWIASIPNLVGPVGLIVTGLITDKIGRKKILQFTYIPIILSWLLLIFANDTNCILIARILLGYSYGCGIVVFMYVSETCPTVYRPLFLAIINVFTGSSMFCASVMGMYLNWRTMAAVYGTISLFGAIGLLAVPEPPMWLRSRGRTEEALRAERWLGEQVQQDDNGGDNEKPFTVTTRPKCPTEWSAYTGPTVWKPAVYGLTFLFLQQCTGIYVLISYSVDVLRDVGIPMDGLTVTAFLSFARMGGSLTFAVLSGVRRRTLTTVSCLGMFSGLAVIVSYLYLFEGVSDPPYGNALIIAFFVYVYFSLLGMLPLPWSLTGELFPMPVKGIMNAVVQSAGYEMLFGATKVYPMLVSMLGIKIVWAIFTGSCLLTAMYGWFLLPETKGKSLDEILEGFEPKIKKSHNTSVT